MWDEDFTVRYIPLPTTIHGITVQDKNGYNNIYINANIGIEEQKKALVHEVTHIARGDFSRPYVPLEEIEFMD